MGWLINNVVLKTVEVTRVARIFLIGRSLVVSVPLRIWRDYS